jgi:hypothetical protein
MVLIPVILTAENKIAVFGVNAIVFLYKTVFDMGMIV